MELTNSAFDEFLWNKEIQRIDFDAYGKSGYAYWAAIRDRVGPMGDFQSWQTEFYPKVAAFLKGMPSNVFPTLVKLSCSAE